MLRELSFKILILGPRACLSLGPDLGKVLGEEVYDNRNSERFESYFSEI